MTILACERHLRDLEASKQPDFPYVFDEERARPPCIFIELLPHVKGRWAKNRELIKLGDWQVFTIASIFGWVRKRDGLRRFREADLFIPRKNAKSTMAAGIGLYMFSMDGEHGAEVYSGATTEKQAFEVFRPAKQMCEMTPDFRNFAGIEVWAKELRIGRDGSRFEPIIGKPGDGSSPHCSIHDEFHEHDTPDQVDTMKTGMGAREQPLLLKITTAGNNLAGPCYDSYLEARKLLEGALEDEARFVIIYGIDEPDAEGKGGDDWTSPRVIAKANPNLNVSIDEEFLLAEQRQAVLNPIHQNRFKTKHLNVWCGARTAWMPLAAWQLCADVGLDEDDFAGTAGWFILDLASKDDLAVFARLYKKRIKSVDHYYFFARYYLPESALSDDKNPNAASYRKWHAQGFLTLTDGEEIDFDVIGEDVVAKRKRQRCKELLYDPWRATQLAQQLAKQGLTTVEVRQTVQNMSTPMKEVLSAVKAGRLHHDGNPVTTWMIANVTAKVDAKDNIYPRKEKPQMKIDGAVALIMGMARAMIAGPSGVSGWLKSTASVGANQEQRT